MNYKNTHVLIVLEMFYLPWFKKTANLKDGCKIDVLWVKEKFTYAYKDGTVEL